MENPMTIGNIVFYFLTIIAIYGFRYFFEPKVKNKGMKKLFINIAIAIILAVFFLWLIKAIHGIAYNFKIDWLMGNYGVLVALLITFVIIWCVEYLYKRVKNNKG